MATSRPQAFTVDLRGHTFAAPGRAPRRLPADAAVRVTSAAENITQAGTARIRFFPDGSSSGGRIVLGGGRHSAVVAVDWLTGAVTVNENGEQGAGKRPGR
jgi:general secretion pathway protein H